MQLSKSIEGFVLSRLADGYAAVTLRGTRLTRGSGETKHLNNLPFNR